MTFSIGKDHLLKLRRELEKHFVSGDVHPLAKALESLKDGDMSQAAAVESSGSHGNGKAAQTQAALTSQVSESHATSTKKSVSRGRPTNSERPPFKSTPK